MTEPLPVPSASRSILVGGLAGFGLSLLLVWIPGLGPVLCCGALVSTGLLAVWHRVAVTRTTLASVVGVRMGAQAGTVAFIASAVLTALGWMFTGAPNMASMLRNQGMSVSDEVQQKTVEVVAQALDQPLVVLAMVLASAALYVVLGLVGGALGAGIFQRANLPGADEG